MRKYYLDKLGYQFKISLSLFYIIKEKAETKNIYRTFENKILSVTFTCETFRLISTIEEFPFEKLYSYHTKDELK